MKHHLEWNGSTLNIRCWECNEILLSISTDGSFINLDSLADSFELACPDCKIACEYSLFETKEGSALNAHDWDSDIDGWDFDGEIGQRSKASSERVLNLSISIDMWFQVYYPGTDLTGLRGHKREAWNSNQLTEW